MKKIISLIALFTILIFGFHTLAGKAKPKQTLEEMMCKGIVQRFNEMDQQAETDKFISSIGNTNDKVEFKENGEVDLLLFKNTQVFDITQLQQQHRLSGLKKFMQKAK
jgi:hypothetical protein